MCKGLTSFVICFGLFSFFAEPYHVRIYATMTILQAANDRYNYRRNCELTLERDSALVAVVIVVIVIFPECVENACFLFRYSANLIEAVFYFSFFISKCQQNVYKSQNA